MRSNQDTQLEEAWCFTGNNELAVGAGTCPIMAESLSDLLSTVWEVHCKAQLRENCELFINVHRENKIQWRMRSNRESFIYTMRH